jgi:hypothetical protein
MEPPWADLTRVRWQLREMQAADRAFREDTGLRLQDISTTADSQLTAAGWMKASFEAVQYNCNRADADAALARATLATEREKHEEELERRVNAWSVRMAEQAWRRCGKTNSDPRSDLESLTSAGTSCKSQ